eukprot:gene34603-41900_t
MLCNSSRLHDSIVAKEISKRLITPSVISQLPLPTPSTLLAKDIILTPIEGGITNYCYRCQLDQSGPVVFVKHARNYTKEFEGAPLSERRLRYDYLGMQSFAKYTPHLVPRVYLYDEEHSMLVMEYLEDFEPITSLFASQQLPMEAARSLGTLMGRNHAKTHRLCLPVEQRDKYLRLFGNTEHRFLWRQRRSLPALQLLQALLAEQPDSELAQPGEGASAERLLAREAAALFRGDELLRILEGLLRKQETSQDTLVHGDLSLSNILHQRMSPSPSSPAGGEEVALKVVDFERCCYGSAGQELGVFLSSYLFFLLAHSQPAARRRLQTQALLVLDAYRAAFRLQMLGALRALRSNEGDMDESRDLVVDVDGVVDEILADALGFAGLQLFAQLFLPAPDPALSAAALREYRHYDAQGRERALQRRLVHLLLRLWSLYRDRCAGITDASTMLQGLQIALQRDDLLLLTEHQTEFWY